MQTPTPSPQTIHVSPEGKISEVQTAIKIASPGQFIQLTNGFYKGFTVTKPGITIEAAQGHENVVILADKGDSITIDCPPDSQVVLRNLKVAHTVSKTELDINKLINLFFKKKQNTKSAKDEMGTITAQEYLRSLSQACLLRVVRGDVYAAACSFSFKIMSKSLETITPAVVAESGTKMFLSGCEIMGHRIYPTIGVICQRADLTMEDCKIYSNLSGAVSALLGKLTRLLLQIEHQKLCDYEQ